MPSIQDIAPEIQEPDRLDEALRTSYPEGYFRIEAHKPVELGMETPAGMVPFDGRVWAIIVHNPVTGELRAKQITTKTPVSANRRTKQETRRLRDPNFLVTAGEAVGTDAAGNLIFKKLRAFTYFKVEGVQEAAEPMDGEHPCPQVDGGRHQHRGLDDDEFSEHSHGPMANGLEMKALGSHRHESEDPMEGFHFDHPEDDGAHEHLGALAPLDSELDDWCDRAVNAHLGAPPWVTGAKEATAQQIGIQPQDAPVDEKWARSHVLLCHSIGCHDARHRLAHSNPETICERMFFVMQDGSKRLANAQDFAAEHAWFQANLPFPWEALERARAKSEARALCEAEMPNQEELRKSVERGAGDWYMVRQPADRGFPATLQRHSRGIWSEAERARILRDLRTVLETGKERTVADIWGAFDLEWLKVDAEDLARAVRKAQDERGSVDKEIGLRLGRDFPGIESTRRLLSENRLVNRGNAHIDLRAIAPGGKHLVGWTFLTPGAIVQRLADGKIEEIGRNKVLDPGPGADPKDQARIQGVKKSPSPLEWLKLVTERRPTFEAEPGQAGATEETAGRFDLVTGGGEPFTRFGRGRGLSVVYGVQRSDFHELFLLPGDPDLRGPLFGRWTFRALKLGDDTTRTSLAEGEVCDVGLFREGQGRQNGTWLIRHDNDPAPFVFQNDWEAESRQAKDEGLDLIWNLDAVAALERHGYFRAAGLDQELAKFRASPRSHEPPSGGV